MAKLHGIKGNSERNGIHEPMQRLCQNLDIQNIKCNFFYHFPVFVYYRKPAGRLRKHRYLQLFMKKNYNYERKKLLLAEYGRHIHEMVDYLCTIEDREQRNFQARCVIAAMGNLNPVLRDTPDYTHKLWDHLFVMSEFQLDVDSPYPIPTAATLKYRPVRLPYPHRFIRRKHYGANIAMMIRALERGGDSPATREALNNIARYMRTKSFEYNQDHPNNEVIIKDIKGMSEFGIAVDEESINNLKNDYKQSFPARGQKKQYQQNRNGKQNRGNGKQNGRPKQRH